MSSKIESQLQIQRNRLLAACEKKVRAMEDMEDAENEIREARMGVATLEFAIQSMQEKGDDTQKESTESA